ncbi:MAG TPA: CHAT domain-containing protein [Thermoanaerobaculia bacterium]|jgi:CHAT domain-containing protein
MRRLVLAAVIAAVAIGVLIVTVLWRTSNERERLAAAYGELPQRPLVLRLSGFPDTPTAPDRKRGKVTNASMPTLRLQSVGSAILTAPDTADPHTYALAQLLDGKHDDAIASLERLIARNPRDASVWNDLAVALFERASRNDDAQSIVSALAATDTALIIAPQREALWNRGRLLEALSLDRAAADAYRRYLAADTVTPAAGEARARLRALERQSTAAEEWAAAEKKLQAEALRGDFGAVPDIVRRFPGRARAMAETEYLANWGATGETVWLELARVIGESLAAQRGERLLLDAVRAIAAADAGRRAELAAAHVAYRSGRKAYSSANRQLDIAARHMEAAGRLFGETPMGHLSRLYRAMATYDENATDAAYAATESLLAEAKPGHITLQGNIWWLRGTIAGRRNQTEESLRCLLKAAELFERSGDVSSEWRMRSDVTATLDALGRSAEAWRQRRSIFRDLSLSGSSELQNALATAARAELRAGRWGSACSLYDLQLSTIGVSPRSRFNALLWRAFAGARTTVRRGQLAPGELESAAMAIEGGPRQDAIDDAQLAEAVLTRPSDPRRALELLDATIASRLALARPSRLPEAYLERARAHTQLQNTSAAMNDYERAIEQIEQSAATVTRDELRDSYFGTVDAAYEELADLSARQGAIGRAFELVDRSRGRLLSRAAPAPLRLPAATTVAQYTVYPDHLLLLTMTADVSRGVRVEVKAETLAATVRQLRTAIGDGDSTGIRAHGRTLFAWLVEPVMKQEPATRTLIVIPDRELANIPFTALTTPRGRYLLEELEVTAALNRSSIRFAPDAARKSGLIVGDPAFDTAAFRLERLPAAAAEARSIAATYPSAVRLTDTAATAANVLRELPSFDVIHFGIHGLADPTDTLRDALLLANGDLLRVKDVAALHLPRAPLVVLAGCSTATAGTSPGTLHSLTAAFLAAGSRGVVGALWAVGDEDALAFSTAFHRRIAAGVAPGPALRETQLEMLHGGAHPAAWSAFQLYGGGQ